MDQDPYQLPQAPPPTPEQLSSMANYSYAPDQIAQLRRSNKRKLVWGLICLIGPSAAIIVSVLLYALIGYFTSLAADSSLTEPSAGRSIANIIMFLIGIVSILAWLPGMVVGIILLATRKPIPRQL